MRDANAESALSSAKVEKLFTGSVFRKADSLYSRALHRADAINIPKVVALVEGDNRALHIHLYSYTLYIRIKRSGR